MSSELLVVFKDSLMGSPSGLQYKITANNIEIDNNNVSKHNNSLVYHFTTKGNIVTISSSGLQKAIPPASEYEIKISIIDKKSEKEIGSTILPNGKKVTMVVISPLTGYQSMLMSQVIIFMATFLMLNMRRGYHQKFLSVRKTL
ncbi:hypothetical protein [Citrobacter koseri]|uniref:hypothetical protein n=1 Tax=Citrobacter koseri TaxID=545 RepID=UPI0040416CD5